MYHQDFLCYDKTCKDRIWVESFHDSVKYEGKKSLVETEKDPEKKRERSGGGLMGANTNFEQHPEPAKKAESWR